MEDFAAVLSAATRIGMAPVLRTHTAFWGESLAAGYTLAAWLADGAVDVELRRRIKAMASRAPFLEDLAVANGVLSETSHSGRKGLGLTVAMNWDSCVFSVPFPPWQQDPLPVATYAVEADETFSTRNSYLPNLFSLGVVANRAAWISKQVQTEVSSGIELLRHRAEWLARLDFCSNAVDQIGAMTGSEPMFRPVVRHLFALNERALAWTNGSFEGGYSLPCSQESESTMDAFGDLRVFRCPDGVKRTFTWHSKINVEKWRVYFSADGATRRVLVAYVGPHLRVTSAS